MRVRVAPVADRAAVMRAAREERCGTLVLNADSRFLGSSAPSDLVAALECPVVFVR